MPNTVKDQVREKLIKAICSALGIEPDYENAEGNEFVDRLIANGVTIQEWISVKDRLPVKEFEEAQQNGSRWYVCLVAWRLPTDKTSIRKAWYDGNCFEDDYNGDITDAVTHWMPLPPPPKGE